MSDTEARSDQPGPSAASGPSTVSRPCISPKLPASTSMRSRPSVGAVLTSEITPPELLPYSAEKGPRSTSTRLAPAMSK